MDNLDNMNTQQLYEMIALQVKNTEVLMRDLKDVKYVLIGNEMNNHTGLIKEFNDFKIDVKEFKKEITERVEKTEHYQTGMKWGTRIIVFIMSSAIVINLTDGMKWIYHTIFEK